MVHGQVSLPLGSTWDSLTWRPLLPEGWTLASAHSLGGLQVQNASIVFTNLLMRNPALRNPETTNLMGLDQFIPINPVPFPMAIQVPAGQTGTKLIQSEITYAWKDGTNRVTGTTSANPIEWSRQEPPLALLTLDVSAGPPILVVQGEPGISCTIQRRDIDLRVPWWSDVAHLRLTNSTQAWIDVSASDRPHGYAYRAILLR